MISSVYKYEDKKSHKKLLVDFDNVSHIWVVDDYYQVYMDLGLFHLPIECDILDKYKEYKKWKDNLSVTFKTETIELTLEELEDDLDLV